MALERSDYAERSITPTGADTATMLRPSNQEMQAHFSGVRTNRMPEPISLDFGSPKDLYGKGNIIAQSLDGYMPPPTLLPDPQIMRIVGEATSSVAIDAYKYGFEHPYRGREFSHMAAIPESSFSQAFSAFPELQSVGKLSEHDTTQLMKALIANELDHYDGRDRLMDCVADALHGSGISEKVTVGYSQISIKGARDLAKEYENEVRGGNRTENPLKKYLTMSNEQILRSLNNPADLPLLVAANLAHNVNMYHRHRYQITEETLGYGFNPDLPPQNKQEHHELMPPQYRLDKSQHAHNVSVWLQEIRAAEGDTQ